MVWIPLSTEAQVSAHLRHRYNAFTVTSSCASTMAVHRVFDHLRFRFCSELRNEGISGQNAFTITSITPNWTAFRKKKHGRRFKVYDLVRQTVQFSMLIFLLWLLESETSMVTYPNPARCAMSLFFCLNEYNALHIQTTSQHSTGSSKKQGAPIKFL